MSNVTVNDSAVQNLFNALSPERRKDILIKALRKGGDKLVADTRQQLRASLGAGATTPNRWNGKTMESGIKMRADKDYCEVSVSIMGDFRLKFFEKGTNLRQTRKTKANRGSIKALNFFRAARAKEDNITATIDQSITELLRRI